MKIDESIQPEHKKRVVFNIVDAPKGNMAVRVRSCGNDCSVKPDQKEEHHETPKDSPTEPSEVNCGSEVCGHGWRSPQANNHEEESQGRNDQGLALTEERSESEIDKGALSGEDEGVETAGKKLKRVKNKKEEVLTESEEPQQQ